MIENSRAGFTLLALATLVPVATTFIHSCRIQPSVAYVSTGILALATLGFCLGWTWARILGRTAAWVNCLLFALLIVPDWDDAVLHGPHEHEDRTTDQRPERLPVWRRLQLR